MPKLRLNKNHRDHLLAHAQTFVEALPLSPEDQKYLDEAIKRRDTVSAALIAKAKEAIAAHYPASDMEVLRRYECLSRKDDARFVVLDNRDYIFEVDFWDDAPYLRAKRNATYEEGQELWRVNEEAQRNARVELPNTGRHGGLIPCEQELYDMHKDYHLAAKEEAHARDRLDEKQRALRSSLKTLIKGAKTYEDVVAVWPAAAEVRGQLGLPSQALSVLSDDALNEIAEASKMYMKLPAVTATKALPAPEVAPEPTVEAPQGVVIDVEPVEDAA